MAPVPDKTPPTGNGVGLAALLLGIFAVAFAFIPLAGEFLSAPAGLAAVAAGFVGWDRVDRGIATNRADALVGGLLGAVALMMALLVYVATNGAG